ncbi:uncharacterized protein [Physcomitrium patens]|uniref:uncharacterized protein isoform X1 n=1 Tax=Physcomitrium patens TaxID=3218 RepID=UPI003CCDBDC8
MARRGRRSSRPNAPSATASPPLKATSKIKTFVFPTPTRQLGPNLQGLFGRTSGTAAGYSYSAANKTKAVKWNETSLYEYLLNPKKVDSSTQPPTLPYPSIVLVLLVLLSLQPFMSVSVSVSVCHCCGCEEWICMHPIPGQSGHCVPAVE